ncbi:hypothetical protein I5M32_11335 [Pedobacter sp. SD-b]|uniref:G domain-containing protein n=1 Tax=Pedobacter segetis TaxID=2793069 RepID=A0ABS1BKX9_9SPHI|nr:hypothetical protein [Pedobacter segetis]MBK0383550.1 hypothetical protein [Pedobacter segetis]
MKKVTIIVGAKNTGKTAKIFEIIGERSFLGLSGKISNEALFSHLKGENTVVFFDEPFKCVKYLKCLITATTLYNNSTGQYFDRPELIISLQKNGFQDFSVPVRRHVSVIDMDLQTT